MTAPQELFATHSHLYPGARGHGDGPLRDGPATLVFADGNRVPATLGNGRLTVAAHATAKGTAIAEKTWVIETGDPDADGRVPFRVAARV